MKARVLMAMAVSCCMCLPALAQDRPKPQQPAQPADVQPAHKHADNAADKHAMPDPAAMQKAMEAAMTPGPMHQWLAGRAGEWDMSIEGMDPMDTTKTIKEKGTTVSKVIYGGRFVMSEVKGTMMGQPFEGMEIMGYNNMTKQFESVWFDSMATAIMKTAGTYNEGTKTMTCSGECNDPMTGAPMQVRNVMKIIDDDRHTFEMYATMSGQPEMKMMTINYTRKGAKSEGTDAMKHGMDKAKDAAKDATNKAKDAANDMMKPKGK